MGLLSLSTREGVGLLSIAEREVMGLHSLTAKEGMGGWVGGWLEYAEIKPISAQLS